MRAWWLFLILCWTTVAQDIPTFGTTVVIPSGLRGLLYYLRPGTAYLPDFSRLQPFGVIYTTKLNVPPQDWTLGFPGLSDRFEWFAIDYTGRFWIEQPGEYKWELTADDGAILYVDDKTVVNLDGQHPPQTEWGRVKLTCGMHRLRVSYFQGPRTHLALLVSVTSPGSKKMRLFDTEEFKPPSNPDDWKKCGGTEATVPVESGRARLRDGDFEGEALMALASVSPPKDFPAHVEAFHFKGQTVVAAGAAAEMMTATDKAEKKRLHVAGLVQIKNAGGSLVAKQPIDAPFEIPAAAYPSMRASELVFSQFAPLPPGKYTLEAALLDQEGHRGATTASSFEVPAESSGIGLSSLILTDRVEPANTAPGDPLVYQGKRIVPMLTRTVAPGAKPFIYFTVYSGAEKASLTVEFSVDGKLAARQNVDVPAAANGASTMMFPAPQKPGDCELKITATQGPAQAVESLRYFVRGATVPSP